MAFHPTALHAQRLDVPRIPPVQKSEWTEPQRTLLQPMEDAGQLNNLSTILANHPDLFQALFGIMGQVNVRSSLSARDRELLILRIGWLCEAEYPWSNHVPMGTAVGLTDADVQHIMDGPSATGLSEKDRLLLQATDELHGDAHISDATWEGLTEFYTTHQLMDLVFTVGQYNLMSMAINSFGVQLEEGVEGFQQ